MRPVRLPCILTWYWDCYETESTFPIPPDDSGFLRWLITSLQSQYSVTPNKTFVSDLASGDDSANFWSSANSCATRSTSQSLCTNGKPTPSLNQEMATGCSGGATVIFEREMNVGHTWVTGTEAKIWNFFRSHPRH